MYISFIVYAAAAYNVFVTDSVKAYVPQICYIQNVEGIVDGTYECTEGYRTCITEELEDGYVVNVTPFDDRNDMF
ncbi:hypothetical protein AAVH_05758 [Aphelenchoides avenae]|nr:hypothetical protein AAVH_05758 [Aphelenchus avenae]